MAFQGLDISNTDNYFVGQKQSALNDKYVSKI